MTKTRCLHLFAPLALLAGMPIVASAQSATDQSNVWTAPDAGFGHDDFGAPAHVLTSARDPVLDATIVTFSTGVRLIVKPTRFAPRQVTVVASFGAGRAGVPERLVHALWATTLFPLGGTRHLSFADLDAWQKASGHAVNVTLIPGPSAFRLRGEVPSSELRLELALLTAYAREPGYREDMAAKIASIALQIGAQIESDPEARFMREVQHRLVGARYQELPEPPDLAATTGSELPEILHGAFGMAANIAIVGDIDVDAAIHAVAATLAAGDPRPVERGDVASVATCSDHARSSDRILIGGQERERIGFYWRLPDGRGGARGFSVARVAAALIEARLVASHVGADPASPPVARAVSPVDLNGGSYLGLAFPATPNGVSTLRGVVNGIVADLSAGHFSDDELSRARKAVAAEHGAEVESNDWWAQHLGVALKDRQSVGALRAQVAGENVGRQAVTVYIRRYIGGVRPTEIADGSAGSAANEGDMH